MKKILAFLVALFLFVSCTNETQLMENEEIVVNPTEPEPVDPIDIVQNVYATGKYGNKACYWVNGVRTDLPTDSQFSEGKSIIFMEGAVHVVGNDGDVAKYWNNDFAVALTDGSENSGVNYITSNNGDVYIAGYEGYKAKYWKNGTPVSLTNGDTEARASYVFIDGTDVYVSGYVRLPGYVTTTGGTHNYSYIYGYVAVYWKNGVMTMLGNSSEPTRGLYVFIKDSKIHVYGYHQKTYWGTVPKYWIDGSEVVLTPPQIMDQNYLIDNVGNAYIFDSQFSSSAAAEFFPSFMGNNFEVIYKTSSNIYLGGSRASAPVYWKNGELYLCETPDGSGVIRSLFVAPF